MKTWVLQCVSRTTGQDSIQRIRAMDEPEAFKLAADGGWIVGKVLEVEDEPAPGPGGTPFERGSALAGAAVGLGVVGIVIAPAAILGWLAAAGARELSAGKKGDGAQMFCGVVSFVWAVAVAIYALTHIG